MWGVSLVEVGVSLRIGSGIGEEREERDDKTESLVGS